MRSGSSATGNNSFNSLVGTGSNKHVVGLDAVISLFSSSCPIVVKQCSFSLGAMNEAGVLDAVESTFHIVFLILSILSVKKFIKSLLLNCEGIFRSGDICLFVYLYKAHSLPAFGKSDHAAIFLTPEYKQRIVQEPPVEREVTRWSFHSEALLQAALDDID